MPRNLLQASQVRLLLKDMQARYRYLASAEDELSTLDRADRYIRATKRMRLLLKQALLFWKGDQLAFLRATAAFYVDYGAILRLLKQDRDRGKFDSHEVVQNQHQGV
jgi:hypothetical protein